MADVLSPDQRTMLASAISQQFPGRFASQYPNIGAVPRPFDVWQFGGPRWSFNQRYPGAGAGAGTGTGTGAGADGTGAGNGGGLGNNNGVPETGFSYLNLIGQPQFQNYGGHTIWDFGSESGN